jgi:hypothetical protein
MKMIPPADEKERRVWQSYMERPLRTLDGDLWHVDVIQVRYD